MTVVPADKQAFTHLYTVHFSDISDRQRFLAFPLTRAGNGKDVAILRSGNGLELAAAISGFAGVRLDGTTYAGLLENAEWSSKAWMVSESIRYSLETHPLLDSIDTYCRPGISSAGHVEKQLLAFVAEHREAIGSAVTIYSSCTPCKDCKDFIATFSRHYRIAISVQVNGRPVLSSMPI